MRLPSTKEDKSAAFEWLRQQVFDAATPRERALAAVALEAWHELATKMNNFTEDNKPQPKFKLGDVVTKTHNSEWIGTVVGTYSTELTPEGYCIESKFHRGAVQIYPAHALELVKIV